MTSTPIPVLTESYTPAGAASAAALTNPSALSGVSAEALAALEPLKVPDTSKVVIRFAPAGNAPVLRNKFYKITASNRFQSVIQFLRKELGWKPQDSLFCYISSAFSPAPDDTVGNLYKCFGTEGFLVVNYSSTAAWG